MSRSEDFTHFDHLDKTEKEALEWRIMQYLAQGEYDGMDPWDVCVKVDQTLERMAKDDQFVRECYEEYLIHSQLIRGSFHGLRGEGVATMLSDEPHLSDEDAQRRPDVVCSSSRLMERLFPEDHVKMRK